MPPSFKRPRGSLPVFLLLLFLLISTDLAAWRSRRGSVPGYAGGEAGRPRERPGNDRARPRSFQQERLDPACLHLRNGNAPVFLETDKGLSNTLQSGGISSLNQFFESLDLRRNPGPEHRKLLVEQMRMRYGHRKLDMIITMYPEALEFVLKDCRDILPDVPILALYLPQGFELPRTDRRIIGHSPDTDIIGTLEIALKLVPGAKRVYVVSGAHEVDRRIEDQARRDLQEMGGPAGVSST